MKTGLIGSGLAALCCFTPVVPWALSTLGLGWAAGYVYRDDVLLPVLATFVAMMGYGLWQRRTSR